MFFLGRGWTPRDELYGITDQLIDPNLGLYKPIGIPEVSTFDSPGYVNQTHLNLFIG
jgi:hypothetical protein